jgi:hypothetical protein
VTGTRALREDRRRAAHARRREARNRLWQALAVTVPLTELVLLVALVAFPETSTGALLPLAGLVAIAINSTLIAGHLARVVQRPGRLDRVLVRAAIAGALAATLVAWIPILGALVLVSI